MKNLFALQKKTLLSLCGLVLCVWTISVAANNDIFEKLQQANSKDITSGIFVCTETHSYGATVLSKEQIADRTKHLVAEIRAEIAEGRHKFSNEFRQAIQKKYGEFSMEVLGKGQELDEYIDDRVEHQIGNLLYSLSDSSYAKTLKYYVSKEFGVRLECEGFESERGGEKEITGRKEVTVKTEKSTRIYTMLDNGVAIKAGTIRKGVTGLARQMNPPHFFIAHKPPLVNFEADNVVSVELLDDPEGVVRVVLADEHDNIFEIDVLPAKGYVVKKYRQWLFDGALLETRFGNFQELKPGLWYPMHQERFTYNVDLPEDIKSKIKSGELSKSSKEVLGSQIITGTQYHMVREISSAEIDVPLDKSLFELKFPDGTRVMDMTDETKHREYVIGIK